MNSRSSNGGARRFGTVALTMAVLAVGAIVPAAAAAAPVNQSRPTISSYNHPHVGSEMLAAPGSWTGSPSFTYQWERCLYNALEACSTITGATTSTYTPTSADITYTIRVKVTGTNSEGSSSAYSTETFPLTARLAACHDAGVGSGAFEDSSCLKAGGTKQYKWYWLSPNPLKVSAGIYHIRWQWSGVLFGAECANSSGEGTFGDNKAGMVVKNLVVTLSSCTVTNPAGKECKISGGKIYLNAMEGSAIEVGANPRIELKPTEGKLGQITFENCSSEVKFLNISYPMENASFYATMSSQNQLVLVQKTLVMQGLEAKWESAMTIKDSSGGIAAFRP